MLLGELGDMGEEPAFQGGLCAITIPIKYRVAKAIIWLPRRSWGRWLYCSKCFIISMTVARICIIHREGDVGVLAAPRGWGSGMKNTAVRRV